MHSSLIAWIMRAIPFGTIIMYGAQDRAIRMLTKPLGLAALFS